jgi:hypothetical protein
LSLNWSIRNVADWQQLADDPTEAVITEGLVFLAMGVSLPAITEKNWTEFYARVALYERLYGSMIHIGGDPRPMTALDVQRRIGLSTNASTLSKTAFLKSTAERFLVEQARHAPGNARYEANRKAETTEVTA